MERYDKITEIMTLIGLPPSGFDRARTKYESLNDDEIERRLRRFRAGKRVVDEWRRQNGLVQAPAETASTEATDLAAEGTPPEWLTLAAAATAEQAIPVARPRAPSVIMIRPFVQPSRTAGDEVAFALEALAVGIRAFEWTSIPSGTLLGRLLRRELLSMAINASETSSLDLSTRAAIFAAVEHRLHNLSKIVVKHPAILSEHTRLTTDEFVDAVARVSNVVDEYRPDIFVTINEGGSIGRIVKKYLGLKAVVVSVSGSVDTKLTWSALPRRRKVQVVCVVGHVAKTGDTLSRVMSEAARVFGTNHVFGIVLAATMEAAEHFVDAQNVQFHHVAESSEPVEIPFDQGSVTPEILDLARGFMRDRYPVEPMPWGPTR